MKNKFSLLGCVLMIAAVLAMLPLTAQATAYSWTGDSSTTKSWDFNTNWGASSTAFPNAYTDTATLTTTTDWPATIGIGTTNTIQLGGLTTTGTGATTVALDIASGGTLGMEGNIANTRRITIDTGGTLSNDDTIAHTISGAGNIALNGGTISSAGGGSWTFSQNVLGFGTISAPFTLNAGSVAANVANQTLHITGNATLNVQRGLGGSGGAFASGALLSIEGGTITAGASGNGIDNYNNVDLRGTFNGITLYRDGSGAYNLRGNSAWNGGFLNTMSFNGYKLDVTGSVGNFGAVNVGTGTLNNPGGVGSDTTISNGNSITLAGGSVTSGGGAFLLGTNLGGWGFIKAPLTINGSGSLSANNGALEIDNPVTLTGGGMSVASTGTLNLKSAMIMNGQNMTIGGTANVSGSGQITTGIGSGITGLTGTGDVSLAGTGQLNLLNTNKLLARNFSMASGTALAVGTSTPISLTGSFSFQQTNTGAWTYGATPGLGPDLHMEGAGTALTPQLLEVGGVNGIGPNNNFALNSLTIGAGTYVKLVDTVANATTSGWVSGSEVLYLNSLVSGGDPPTFDLNGIICYVDGVFLGDGLYNGINVIDAGSPVPIPPSALLLGSGLLGLALLRLRRQKSVAVS